MLKIISKGNFESIQEFTVLQNKKLGSGSFGTVKLAIHNSTNRMYALKIISLANLPSEQQIKLVEREIKLHSEMDHPHIAKVWDTFNDNQQIYMVMEYAEIGNLFFHQNTKNIFSEAEAYKYFSQTVQAIKYLHNNDIIHRDLKPQNLLLDQYYNIKICDFGWCAENIHQKRTTFCGTYEYMAPEMIFRSDYDYRVDVWALGILLYEMLHGTAPFKGKTIDQVQASMLQGSYELSPKISKSAKNIIESILQFKPEKRIGLEQICIHEWMIEMEDVIKNYIKQEQVSTPEEIHLKITKIPISMFQLKALKKEKPSKKGGYHRKNNSMNLDEDTRSNININLSINNFAFVNKKNKKHMYHSQDKLIKAEQNDGDRDFSNFKEVFSINSKSGPNKLSSDLKLKKANNKNSELRCKTLVDEQNINLREKPYYDLSSSNSKITGKVLQHQKRASKDQQPQNHRHEQLSSKLDLNFLKKNLKFRKSQEKIDKPVRFNTEAYEKEEDSQVVKFKKAAGKKSKVLTSSAKNLKNHSSKMLGNHF